MMTKIYFRFSPTILLYLFITSGAFAQSGILKGIIIDKKSQQPVPFASIVLEKDGKIVEGTAGDINGTYCFKKLTPGKFILKVSNISYKLLIMQDVCINPDKITFLNIVLEPKAINLSCVEVVAYKMPLFEYDSYYYGNFFYDSNDQRAMLNNSITAEKKTNSSFPVENKILKSMEFKCFPNPTTGIINIEMNAEVEEIYLLDMTGTVVKKYSHPLQKTEIDMADLPNGIYFIQYTYLGKNFAKKVILQHS